MGLTRLLLTSTLIQIVLFGQRAADPRPPGDVAAGQKLFVTACAGCHGRTGEGGRGPNLSDGTLVRRSTNQRLFSSIKNGVPGTDMPGFPLPDDTIWSVVAYMRSLSAPAIESRPTGDVTLGRAVFFGSGRCSQCHAVRAEGGHLGPDLTNAGATRTVKQLREAVLDPSARIADGYQTAKITTVAGESVEGVARNYNNYSIQMLDRSGQLRIFSTHELKAASFPNQSLMPKISLTPDELQHLIAFLSVQAVRK